MRRRADCIGKAIILIVRSGARVFVIFHLHNLIIVKVLIALHCLCCCAKSVRLKVFSHGCHASHLSKTFYGNYMEDYYLTLFDFLIILSGYGGCSDAFAFRLDAKFKCFFLCNKKYPNCTLFRRTPCIPQ